MMDELSTDSLCRSRWLVSVAPETGVNRTERGAVGRGCKNMLLIFKIYIYIKLESVCQNYLREPRILSQISPPVLTCVLVLGYKFVTSVF